MVPAFKSMGLKEMPTQQTHHVHSALGVTVCVTKAREQLSSPPTEGTNMYYWSCQFHIQSFPIVSGILYYSKREVELNRFFFLS